MKCAARGSVQIQDAKKSPSRHHRTNLSGHIFASKACIDNRKKDLLNTNTSSTCPHNMVNFGQITAENCWRVWGTPANFKGFRVLSALLHGTPAVGVSQTLRRWTEGATYIRQGGHHVGHWPTFLVSSVLSADDLIILSCIGVYLIFRMRIWLLSLRMASVMLVYLNNRLSACWWKHNWQYSNSRFYVS